MRCAMPSWRAWNRREMLSVGLTACALPWMPASSLRAQEKGRPSVGTEGKRKTFLFVDWFHVKKGDLQVTLDPTRVSDTGRTLLETYARDFQKTFEQGNHGF